MGQKINPRALKIGTKIGWDSTNNGKNFRRKGLLTVQEDSIGLLIVRFFKLNGFEVADFRLHFNETSLKLYVYLFSASRPQRAVTNFLSCVSSSNKTKAVSIQKKGRRRSDEAKLTFELLSSKKGVCEKDLVKGLVKLLGNVLPKKKISLVLEYWNKSSCFAPSALPPLKKKVLALHRFKQKNFFRSGIETMQIVAKSPEFSALLLSYIITQLTSFKNSNIFLKFLQKFSEMLIKDTQYPVTGVKLKLAGRINGAERARVRFLVVGDVPCQSVDSYLRYESGFAKTRDGAVGVKLWLVSKRIGQLKPKCVFATQEAEL